MEDLDWLQIGVMVATVLGSLGVFIQASIASRQAALQEIESARQERDVWSRLADDWKLARIVALGPRSGARIDPQLASSYGQRLVRYRDAHLAAWASDEHPDPTDEVSGRFEHHFERVIADDIAAYNELRKERSSVERVLSHLAQVATFYFERKVSISAIYSASGPELVEGAWMLGKLTKFAPDYMDGCVAGVYEEARYWRTLDLDSLSPRLGWASVLGASVSSLGRLDALLAALAVHAHKIGDLHEIRVDSVSVVDVGEPTSLARIWKVARPMSWRRAWVLCFQAAYYRDAVLHGHAPWWRRLKSTRAVMAIRATLQAAAASKALGPMDRWLPTARELETRTDPWAAAAN